MVRAGLRQFLEDDRSITEIGEAASGNETLDKLRTGSWDLVILDINMPDRSGLDILRYIRASYPDTKVLVLSGFPEKQYAINVLKAGSESWSAPGDRATVVNVEGVGRVGLFVCGLTPYAEAHVGHGRVFVVFDSLVARRHLSTSSGDRRSA